MSVVFYISGHGFGHAARAIQVVNALGRRAPSQPLLIRTAVPRWFVDGALEVPATILEGDTDTGVVQPDGLTVDEAESVRRADAFYRTFNHRVDAETTLLRAQAARLVVSDAPPLACAAADRAGIPCAVVSNFTWDWIYGGYPLFDAAAPHVRATIAEAYSRTTLALRLPFAGGFESMPRVEDAPLVARRARVERGDARARLALPDDRPIVLATFGGHRSGVSLVNAADEGSFLLVATDYEVRPGDPTHPAMRVIPAATLHGLGLTYTDLLAACDAAASKLGYGIVSECIANDVALLFALRGQFPEQDVMMRELPEVLRCRLIAHDTVVRGQWGAGIAALLAQAQPRQRMRADGADHVAARLLEMC